MVFSLATALPSVFAWQAASIAQTSIAHHQCCIWCENDPATGRSAFVCEQRVCSLKKDVRHSEICFGIGNLVYLHIDIANNKNHQILNLIEVNLYHSNVRILLYGASMCMTTTMVNHLCYEFHPPFPKVYASKDIDRHYRHGDPADLKLGMLRLHDRLRLEAEKRPPTKHERNIEK